SSPNFLASPPPTLRALVNLSDPDSTGRSYYPSNLHAWLQHLVNQTLTHRGDDTCNRCQNPRAGKVFKTCVQSGFGDALLSGGSCSNCCFDGNEKKCSFNREVTKDNRSTLSSANILMGTRKRAQSRQSVEVPNPTHLLLGPIGEEPREPRFTRQETPTEVNRRDRAGSQSQSASSSEVSFRGFSPSPRPSGPSGTPTGPRSRAGSDITMTSPAPLARSRASTNSQSSSDAPRTRMPEGVRRNIGLPASDSEDGLPIRPHRRSVTHRSSPMQVVVDEDEDDDEEDEEDRSTPTPHRNRRRH
ncbi:hypothetical protein DM02DRAFT_32144, partial [Periconia macrospinosa]